MSQLPRKLAISDAASWCLMPQRNLTYHDQAPWVTATVYSQGDIVRGLTGGDTPNELYMALGAGTSAGAVGPVNLNGEALDAGGGVLWLYVPQLPRAGGEITNDSDQIIYVGLQADVASGEGNRINAGGGTYTIPKPNLQEALYGIVVSGGGSSKNVSIQER